MISRKGLAFGKLCLPICTLLFQYWPRMVVLELNLSPYLSSCYHLTANGLGRMVFLGLKFDSQCVSLLASLLVCFPGKMIFWESIFFFQCVRIFFSSDVCPQCLPTVLGPPPDGFFRESHLSSYSLLVSLLLLGWGHGAILTCFGSLPE